MAENRCSMCGNTNAADAQVCVKCGARLTPVRPPKKNGNTGKFTGGLSWLDAFREETQPADAAASAFGQGESSYEQEMSSFEQESSGYETPSAPSDDEDAPQWLQRIRDRNESEQPTSSYDSDAEIRVDEGSLSLGGEEEDVPDWLRSLKEQETPATEQQEEIPSWQDAMRTWDTNDDEGYSEDSDSGEFEGEPKVTEWFSRIIPGDEEEKPRRGQTVNFEQENIPKPGQTVNFEQEEDIPRPKQTVQFQQESDGFQTFSPFESGEEESVEETALPDDAEFLAQFKDYEVPSGFTEEDYAEARGEEVQYEDWETRSANLHSVTEVVNANEDAEVPSWLGESEEGESEDSSAAMDDSAQSVLSWLEELDEKEGSKQKARYWMGDVDTGELPPEKSVPPQFKESPKQSESVYDPFAEDKSASPGATQFFNEDDLDDEDIAPVRTPVHTMMFDQDESEKDIPDWLSGEPDEEYGTEAAKPGQTVGLGGLDDAALGMDLPEDEKAPWELDSFGFNADEDSVPKMPVMTAQLSGLDDEEDEDEELPPWMQSSTEATEPRKQTPIMTADLGYMDDEDEGEEDVDAPWLQQSVVSEGPSIPKAPKMTAALPGLDDEDLGMDLEDDEIPPWLQEAQEEKPGTSGRPIMTAALDGFEEEEEDETLAWLPGGETPEYDQRPPIITSSSTDADDEDLESDEVPSWMNDIKAADVNRTPSQPLMTAELPDLGGEPTDDAFPSWMEDVDKAYDEQPSQPLITEKPLNIDDSGTAEELVMPWMQEEEAAPPAISAPLMTAPLIGLDNEDLGLDETPAWMQDIEEVTSPAKGTPTMTAALTGLDEDDFQTEETPAWMQDLEEIAPPPGAGPVMTVALPDLDQNEPTMPPPAPRQPVEAEDDEIPDWMRSVEETRQLGRMGGQPPAEPASTGTPRTPRSPFTVGLTGDAEEKEQSIDEMFSEDLFTTGKLNEMTGTPQAGQNIPTQTAEEEQSIDELFSEDLFTTGKLNEMAGTPQAGQNIPAQAAEDEDLSIDELFSEDLFTTGKLNEMAGTPQAGQNIPAQAADDEEQSIDEMFSDQLLTTGILNAMSGVPNGVQESPEEDQSIDEMFSDQLLTTGILNAMSGVPDGVQESPEEEQSVDEMFSDQLLTTGILNAMSGVPDGVEDVVEEDSSLDELFSAQPFTTGAQTPDNREYTNDEDESVDEMFSDQLFTTGILNKMQDQDQSSEGVSIDEAFSGDLLNTGKLKDLSAGLEPTQELPTEPFSDSDWLADFEAAGSDDDMLVGASVVEDEPKALPELSSDMPDWLTELEPEGKEAHAAEGPAFVFDVEPEEPEKVEESHPFAGDDLPNWLSPEVWQADGQSKSENAPASADAGVANIQWELEGLEKGELPSWLQQIKPDQTAPKRKAPLTTAQIDEQSEKVGPLAGLSGVLPAQDMVTMYRKPPVYSDQILLSERQSNRMQVLSRMIDSEAKNKTLKVGVEKIPFNMMRMIFAIVLVIIMVIPLSGLIPITGGLPFAASDPVVAFFNQVENFPENSSVLLVMDFESGYTAEMRSSLDGLMMRLYEKNIDVAMISTLPTGPVIAEEIAQDNWLKYYAVHPDINVVDYETRVLNLGYLPGGSAAMLQFVRYPRQSVQYGFRYEKDPTSVWETQVLSDVYNTNDFSGVVVVTDSANISRNWIEQTTLYALDNILFITSAQTYPLILPYWQSGQVKGLIAGVYQGYTYRTLLGQSEGLEYRWYSYQFGMNLVTIVAIFLTIIFVIRNTLPRIRKTR